MKNGINEWPSDINCTLHYDVKCDYYSKFQPQSPSDFSIKACNGGKVKKTGSRIISIPVEKSESKLHRGHINPVAENADIVATYSVSGVAPPRLKRARSEITKVHLNAVDVSEICVFFTAECINMLLNPEPSTLPDKTCVIEMESPDFYSLPCLVMCSALNSVFLEFAEICESSLLECCVSTVYNGSELKTDVVTIYSNLPVHVFDKKHTLDQKTPSMHYSSPLASCLLASANHPQWTERCNSENWPWDPGIHNRQ